MQRHARGHVLIHASIMAATLVASAATSLAAAPADEISLDRARVLYNDGNYKDAVATLSKLQDVKTGVDRVALFMLKADAHIHLGEVSMAIASLGMAHKEADKPEPKMLAAALELLVRRSPSMTYKPRTGDTDRTFDIVADAPRKEAFAALLADETDAAGKRLAAAKAARDVATLAENSRPLANFRAVEFVVTGKMAASDEMARTFREKLFAIVEADMTKDEATVKTLLANANKVNMVWVNFTNPNGQNMRRQEWHKQGPTTAEKGQLNSLKTTHERLAVQLNELVTDLAIAPESTKIYLTRNTTLIGTVTGILTADYEKPTTRPAGG